MDNELSGINEEAWNQDTYDAWIHRFGEPEVLAAKLKKDPSAKLYPIIEFFGDVKGKKVINLMGSNGVKATALSLLGADASVADFSEGNRRYALELAEASGIKVEYLLCDVLKLSELGIKDIYDIAFAELGILHYFTDLHPFFKSAYHILKYGGKFILRDFHPVSTKLIASRGTTAKIRKHKVEGDYFDTSLQEVDVSFSKYLTDTSNGGVKKAVVRRWNLGEIVTSAADEGFIIEILREEPNLSSDIYDKGIPKTFTLVTRK